MKRLFNVPTNVRPRWFVLIAALAVLVLVGQVGAGYTYTSPDYQRDTEEEERYQKTLRCPGQQVEHPQPGPETWNIPTHRAATQERTEDLQPDKIEEERDV